MADAATAERLTALAWRARRFLEPQWWCWRESEGGAEQGLLSRGACDRSSLFLVQVLADEGIAARFVTGAPAHGPYGYFCNGAWRGHAWVESEGLILDVTADQFGGPPVQVVPVGDAHYSGGEDIVDVQVAQARHEAVDRMVKVWRAGAHQHDDTEAPWRPDDFSKLCDEGGGTA